eukprot:587826-Pleurochrysis_carterae.AAC.1
MPRHHLLTHVCGRLGLARHLDHEHLRSRASDASLKARACRVSVGERESRCACVHMHERWRVGIGFQTGLEQHRNPTENRIG